MTTPERILEEASHYMRKWSKDARRSARRKRKQRLFRRMMRAALAMLFVTFIVIPAMIASGFLLGPKGYEGVIAAPLVLLASYSIILYWTFRRQKLPAPQKLLQGNAIALLPAQTDEWLDEQRSLLPLAAQRPIDSLSARLEALTPQLSVLDPQAPAAAEVRRLLSEELPDLVRGYRKVPNALAQQPLYGGLSPERQLVEGLETIDKQIVRVHEQLAKDDLHALATHQRYLELKYKREDEQD
jgi:uncharacterized membrane protein YqjE